MFLGVINRYNIGEQQNWSTNYYIFSSYNLKILNRTFDLEKFN